MPTSPSPRWDCVRSDLTQVVLTAAAVHVGNRSAVFRKQCFLIVIYGLWFLLSFCPLFQEDLSLWRKECDMDFPFMTGHSAVSCNLTSCGPPCELPSMQQEASLKGTRSCLGSASELSLRYLSVSGSLTQTTVTWVQPGNIYIRMTLLSLAQTDLERWGGKKSKQG